MGSPADPYRPSASLDWQQELAGVLLACGASAAVAVPDSRLDGILRYLTDQRLPVRMLTREDECVGFAVGHRLTGLRPVLLMQCSGLGNSANALASLSIAYGLTVPLVISMRGTLGERNPSQVPMGQATVTLLASLGVQAFSIRCQADVEPVTRGAMTLCFDAGCASAILLEPELGGGNDERD